MTNRRSTRKTALKNKDVDYEEHDAQSDASVVEVEPPAPKRRKRKAAEVDQGTREQLEAFNVKKPKLKKGYLRQVTDMPIDVVYEIFARLNPVDLLNLSRTSKALRVILISKQSISVWKDARTNVIGLPDCPATISEPQYANLVFGNTCDLCGKAPLKTVACFDTYLRICRACAEEVDSEHFVNKYTIIDILGATSFEVRDSLPSFNAKCFPTKKGRLSNRYDHDGILFPVKAVVKAKEEYSKLETVEAREVWLQDRKAEKKQKKIHEEAVTAFLKTQSSVLIKEKVATAEARMSILADRAEHLGWSEEILFEGTDAVSILSQSDIITKACKKNISAAGLKTLEVEINRIFSELKKKRLVKIHTKKIKLTMNVLREIRARYVAKRPMDEPQPSVGDLFHFHDVRNACIACAQDPASDPASALQFVEDGFADFRERWLQRGRRILLQFIEAEEKVWKEKQQKSVPEEAKHKAQNDNSTTPQEPATPAVRDTEPVPQIDKLELAMSLFRCSSCSTHSLRFPNILAHDCAHRADIGKCGLEGQSDWVSEAFKSEWGKTTCEGTWNWNLCIHVPTGSELANLHAVLDLLKLDPKTTTFEELEKLNPIVECLHCHSMAEGRCLMSWGKVLTHVNRCYKTRPGPRWAIVEDEDSIAIARKRISDANEAYLSTERTLYSWRDKVPDTMLCAVSDCRKSGKLMGLRRHIRRDHGRHPVEGDLVFAPGTPSRQSQIRFWPPRSDIPAADS